MGKAKNKIASFMKKNPGEPFILAFIVLLIIASLLLALGRSNEASSVAEVSYYYLIIGVILQLLSLIIHGGRKS